jgi:hypothetical protein
MPKRTLQLPLSEGSKDAEMVQVGSVSSQRSSCKEGRRVRGREEHVRLEEVRVRQMEMLCC